MLDLLSKVRRFSIELGALARAAEPRAVLTFSRSVVRALPQIIRQGVLRPADIQMSSRTWRFRVDGTDVLVRGEDFAGAREIYARRVYCPTAGFRIHPGDTVLDLGANVGLFSVLAALKGAHVLAIEAQSGFRAEIEEIARLNGCLSNIDIIIGYVGAGGTFATPADALRGSHGATVPSHLRISELMERAGLHEIDLLKCDIEGAEFALVAQDAQWLSRVRRIVMEVHPPFGDTLELCKQLRAAGFHLLIADSERRIGGEPDRRGGYVFATRKTAPPGANLP